MSRSKKEGFMKMKMLSSRVEEEDYLKFEAVLRLRDHKNIQEALNGFIVSYISGAIQFSGSDLVPGDGKVFDVKF